MVYVWRCEGCNCKVEIERPMVDCTMPPSGQCLCAPEALPRWVRAYEAPMLMRASYPDGVKRKGWAELKEAAKLDTQAVNLPKDKRSEIAREIRKLRKGK